jgi:sugar lactone lactonase YvrE
LVLGARAASAQKIQTIIGWGNEDGLLATQTTLNGPWSLATNAAGTIYVTEIGSVSPGGGYYTFPQIRKITSDGKITRVAGNLIEADGGDGGKATEAPLDRPYQVAADAQGNLYVVERISSKVRKIDAQGIISTFAGSGTAGFAGDGGKATEAQLSAPRGVAVGPDGSVYIADTGNNRVRRVAPDGTISAFAGTGNVAFDGDGGKASEASLSSPQRLAVDAQGNVYITDVNNGRIRRVTTDGIIKTVAGNGQPGATGDGGDATAAALEFPWAIALDAAGNLYIDQVLSNVIRRVTPDGKISTVAGTGTAGFNGEAGKASEIQLNSPLGIAVDASNNLLIADSANGRVRRLTPDGMITTIAGGAGASGLPASQVTVILPRGGVSDAAGNVYVADIGHYRILKVDPNGMVTVAVGTGAPGGYKGEGLKGTDFSLGTPDPANGGIHIDGMAIDTAGNLYFPELYLARVFKLDTNGIVTTVAGSGQVGFAGDGGKATEAQFGATGCLCNIAFDTQGNLYIADGDNHRVRRVDKDGIINTFAGNGSEAYSGDGGKAVDAGVPQPDGLGIGPDGSLYITDTADFRVRRVTPDGIITTVAGNGEKGYSGDGGKAIDASVSDEIENVAIDAAGNLYLADGANNVIRKVDPSGIITTFAGTGNEGFNGDDKALTETNVSEPRDLYITAKGNLIFTENNLKSTRVRIIIINP